MGPKSRLDRFQQLDGRVKMAIVVERNFGILVDRGSGSYSLSCACEGEESKSVEIWGCLLATCLDSA
jgi:hypothetical protein